MLMGRKSGMGSKNLTPIGTEAPTLVLPGRREATRLATGKARADRPGYGKGFIHPDNIGG